MGQEHEGMHLSTKTMCKGRWVWAARAEGRAGRTPVRARNRPCGAKRGGKSVANRETGRAGALRRNAARRGGRVVPNLEPGPEGVYVTLRSRLERVFTLYY